MASQLITRRSPRLNTFSTILGDACQVDDTFARVVGATTPTIVPQPRQASLLLPFQRLSSILLLLLWPMGQLKGNYGPTRKSLQAAIMTCQSIGHVDLGYPILMLGTSYPHILSLALP